MENTMLEKASHRYNILSEVVMFLGGFAIFSIIVSLFSKNNEIFILGILLLITAGIFTLKMMKTKRSLKRALVYHIDHTLEKYLEAKGVYKYGYVLKTKGSSLKCTVNIYDELGYQYMTQLGKNIRSIIEYADVQCSVSICQKHPSELITE